MRMTITVPCPAARLAAARRPSRPTFESPCQDSYDKSPAIPVWATADGPCHVHVKDAERVDRVVRTLKLAKSIISARGYQENHPAEGNDNENSSKLRAGAPLRQRLVAYFAGWVRRSIETFRGTVARSSWRCPCLACSSRPAGWWAARVRHFSRDDLVGLPSPSQSATPQMCLSAE